VSQGRPAGADHRSGADHVAVAEPSAQLAGQAVEHAVRVRPRWQREQGADPGVVQRSDQGGNPCAPARRGRRVGHPQRAGMGLEPGTGAGARSRAGARAEGGCVSEPDHHGQQPPAGDRHAEGPGPGLSLRGAGVPVAKERAQDRPVRLPLQAFPLVVEQPAEREGGRRALDQRHVEGLGSGAARHDQPAHLAARAVERQTGYIGERRGRRTGVTRQ
jgi:hypothetical protein